MAPPTITNQEFDQKLGMELRRRRVQLGLSQKAVAQSMGFTFQQIQKYEKGFNTLSAFRLSQVAGCLGTTAEAMLGAAFGPQPLALGVLSNRETLEMMKRANLLTRQEQKAVACFIQELTEGRVRSDAAATSSGEGR